MAELHHARVLRSEAAGDGLWTVEAVAEADVGALPGQWGAFHTDLPNPAKPGQTLRRAWSFLRVDGSQFELLVAVVGTGTRWLAERRPGDALPFTGPWGSRFVLDGDDAVGFYAAGSGVSAVATMVDAAVSAGRPVRFVWDRTSGLEHRLAAWRAAGVEVELGATEVQEASRRWWYAGDGERLDAVLAGRDVPATRVERFYTPRPA
jgi:NAD(P)H-flavin reductase